MTDENEDILQKLAPSIVEIISDDKEGEEETSTTLGTGFVVTDDGLVVTCRHVVTDSEDNLMNFVKVRFHTDGKTDVKYTASRVREDQNFKDDSFIDIAFLKLDKLPEKGVTPVKLDDKVVSLNHFASIGFKKAREFKWLSAIGDIGIPTEIKSSKGYPSPEAIELHSNQIEPGMSGAPVLDIERDRVVGIISDRYKEEYNPAVSNMAFALPVNGMIELYPNLREKNQGLTLLSKFLHAIGEESSQIYKWIDEVYVPPMEYEEIKAALKKDRIIFITGTKEFGKTFTAVQLLYEFFKEGNYQPRWIKERKDQRGLEGADPEELMRLTEEEGYIKPHQTVYFEDPFGKTEYVRSNDLENYIGSIIVSIKRVQDAYVIITSREEVFKEFQKEHLSSIELAKFEKKLNLKRASYDLERRKKILLNWAKVNNCKWLLDSGLTNLIIDAIENQELLPTPLNIKDFVKASHDVFDSKELKDLMKQQSGETARRFADEIIRMEEDEKILFLAFPYLSYGTLYVDFIKEMYESIISGNAQSSQKPYMDFERVKKWFAGDKVNISGNKIVFSHPSYYEAFQYAIDSEKRYNDKISSGRIRDIFARVLLRLSDEHEATEGLSYAIAINFKKLPPNVQQLLFKLADEAAGWVALSISYNFGKLPANIREQLLLKLADDYDAARGVARAIAYNFNQLPPNVQQLLFKLADDHRAVADIAYAIAYNFNQLPPNVQQLLFKLADNDEAAWNVTRAIIDNSNQLPTHVQHLLFKLTDNDNAARFVLDRMVEEENFNQLPANIREQLLLKLSENDNAALGLGYAIIRNFDKLPTHVQQLLFKLAENDKTAGDVAYAIEQNFNQLPANIREQLLLKLSENDNAAPSVAYAIEQNFNQLPANIREQLLLKLAENADNDEASGGIACAIVTNFNELPTHVQQLLFKLTYDDEAAVGVAIAIIRKFNELPTHVQQLLFKLTYDDDEESSVAKAIVENFNELPTHVQQLLFKLVNEDRSVAGVAYVIAMNFNELPTHVQQLLFKLADDDEAAENVAYVVARCFTELPSNIGEQLLLKLADKDSTAGIVSAEIWDYSNKIPDNIRREILAKLEEKGVT